jgi:hypothetical protein
VISGGPAGQTTADTANFGLSVGEGPLPDQLYADVPSGSPLYEAVQRESARGVISGYYSCGLVVSEPCDGASRPYLRPNANVTRAQFARLLDRAAGWSDAVSGQTFEDVTPTNPFYLSIERAASHGAISGYPCGTPPADACQPQSRPYFVPGKEVTRGELAKGLDAASLFADPVSGETYSDVLIGSTFYTPIERLTALGIMSGYQCGTAPAGACDPQQNRPYFLPSSAVTRGQAFLAIWTASRSPESLSCSLSGHGRVASGACSGQVSYTGLALDDYTFTLTGSDQIGNHNSATRQFTVVAQPSPDSTSTAVVCSPAAVGVGEPASCTATVNDTSQGSPSFPTGLVSFTTDSPGAFGTPAGCTLSPSATQGQSSCALGYKPTAPGSHQITASYGGDSAHGTSSGGATLTVSSTPSDNFTIAPASCTGVCHELVVKVTVPGPGAVSARDATTGSKSRLLSSAKKKKNQPRIKPVKVTATKAGIVRLKLQLTKAGTKILKQKGKLKVPVRITFTPSGGTPKSMTVTVTFKGR